MMSFAGQMTVSLHNFIEVPFCILMHFLSRGVFFHFLLDNVANRCITRKAIIDHGTMLAKEGVVEKCQKNSGTYCTSPGGNEWCRNRQSTSFNSLLHQSTALRTEVESPWKKDKLSNIMRSASGKRTLKWTTSGESHKKIKEFVRERIRGNER